jgi:hypothetical protein
MISAIILAVVYVTAFGCSHTFYPRVARLIARTLKDRDRWHPR